MKKAKKSKEQVIETTVYGANELKSVYKKFMTKGLIFAVALHVFVISAVMISMYYDRLNAENQEEDNIIKPIMIVDADLELPPAIVEEEIPQDVVEKIIPKKDLAALIPQPVKKVEVTDDVKIKTQQQLDDVTGPISSKGDENANNNYTGNIKIDDRRIEDVIEKDDVIKIAPVEIYESFQVSQAPGVINLSEVQSSMTYPEIAITSGTEGRVSAKVLVGKNGRVEKIGSLTGPSVFHSEVKSKLRDLVFTAALNNGEQVKCWVTVPFNFKLKKGF